jgi:hypothetical protein
MSALYSGASGRALLCGKCPHYTVRQVSAHYFGKVSALYCGEEVSTLLWGKYQLSNVVQVSALYCCASVRALL